MKTDFFSFFNQRPDVKFNKKLFVFVVCLVISLCSWLQINLSKDQVSSVLIHVDFINLPKNKFGLSKISDTLLVEVEADGYSLLKYKMKDVSIDFKRLKKDVSTGEFYFLPNNYTKTIAKQMGDNIKVIRSVSDTVPVNLKLK